MAFRGWEGGINMKQWSSDGNFTMIKKRLRVVVLSQSHSLVALHWEHLKSDHFSHSKKSINQSIKKHQQRGSCKSILQMPIYELPGEM